MPLLRIELANGKPIKPGILATLEMVAEVLLRADQDKETSTVMFEVDLQMGGVAQRYINSRKQHKVNN